MPKFYFTSESVTSGHPDKVCDLIADSILDEALRQDPKSHMAVEATIKDDLILVYGEAGTNAVIDYEKIALQVMRAGVAAVIMDVVLDLGGKVFETKDWINICLMIAAFVASWIFKVSSITLILLFLCLGVARYFIERKKVQA